MPSDYYGNVAGQLNSLPDPWALASVDVTFGGEVETVWIDPWRGPRICRSEVDWRYMEHPLGTFVQSHSKPGTKIVKRWNDLTCTEKEVLVIQTAKLRRRMAACGQLFD
mmetsp:Transcript_45263/g.140326  ORF Transcript_45263/g.140326 Transcript_45263/m.140326 type:complete len:109 (+) Transcript_45263:115-441(+)